MALVRGTRDMVVGRDRSGMALAGGTTDNPDMVRAVDTFRILDTKNASEGMEETGCRTDPPVDKVSMGYLGILQSPMTWRNLLVNDYTCVTF